MLASALLSWPSAHAFAPLGHGGLLRSNLAHKGKQHAVSPRAAESLSPTAAVERTSTCKSPEQSGVVVEVHPNSSSSRRFFLQRLVIASSAAALACTAAGGTVSARVADGKPAGKRCFRV